ncbi:MAG: hypothetical protein NVS1B3_12500 [Candidatus Dormibacteraceae bacterium]
MLDLKEVARRGVRAEDAVLRVEEKRHHRSVLEQVRKNVSRRHARLERYFTAAIPKHGRSI